MRLILVISLLGLSACGSLQRDRRSGYGDESEDAVNGYYQDQMSKDESDTREELGYGSRPLTEAESANLDKRLRLHRLESKLESKRDRKQYYTTRGLMRDDVERINFLSLQNYEARQSYLRNRGLLTDAGGHSEPVAKAIEAQDIMLGMNQKAVRESWGDPDLVETAGDPMYGNERWNYHRVTAGNDGYQKELRIVYFESGKVVGWETPN